MKKLSEETKTDQFPIVGVGASAGGLDAITALIGQLPKETDMAFVIVQHLDPKRESYLREIISRSSQLPVTEPQEGEPVKPNHIYVIPAGKMIELQSRTFHLSNRPTTVVRQTSIDYFFESLASSLKTKAIGVVLSGTANDGTTGLRAIKAAGGITYVQHPHTAKFDGMPRSAIAAGMADVILPPEEIGKDLVRISKHPYTKAQVNADGEATDSEELNDKDERPNPDPAFNKILALLRVYSPVDFSNYKLTTVKRRVHRQMMLSRTDSLEAYAEHLRLHPEEVKSLYGDIFIHVTDFFRDPDAFAALKNHIFPMILKNKAAGSAVRIWIPGCATGEEAYSLAISLVDLLGPRFHDIKVSIFATDISEAAIQKARKGTYSQFQVRHVPEDLLHRFFESTHEGYKINKAIREICVFSQHDVTKNPPFAKLDLVSCRNVLIYFGPELQKQVLPIFHFALNPDGYLWLGRSETAAASPLFKEIDKVNKIYSRVNAVTSSLVTGPLGPYKSNKIDLPLKNLAPPLPSLDYQRNADQIILFKYGPPGVVINSNQEVLQFRGRTSPYLEIPPGKPTYNLLRMAHPELVSSLSAALDTVKQQNTSFRKENVQISIDGVTRTLNLEVTPIDPTATPKDRHFLVLFEEPENYLRRQASETRVTPGRRTNLDLDGDQLVSQLQDELGAARKHQQSLIEEYESAQEELTSASEELQATNEELQSTNEELTTATEEMQAANEELITMNEELQNRNDDLKNALEALEKSESRFRLLVESVQDYAIFMLDPSGCIATWNPGAKRLKLYDEREIIGRHFSIFYPREDIENKKPEMELRVASQTGRFEDEGWRIRKDGTRFWANVVISAIYDKDKKLIGFAKVTRDLTERRKAEEQVRTLNQELEKRVVERTGALEIEKAKLRSLLMQAPAFVLLMQGPHHVIQFCNEMAIKGFGRDLKGLTIKEALPDFAQKGLSETLDRSHESGTAVTLRETPVHLMHVMHGEGETELRYMDSLFTPWRDLDGKVAGILSISFDVTERVLSKKHLERAIKTRDEFLTIASHELKTPLTSLGLQLQMTKRAIDIPQNKIPSAEKLARVFDISEKQVKRLSHLIEDLLDVSRIETGRLTFNFEEVNFSEIVRDMIERFSGQFNRAKCQTAFNIEDGIILHGDHVRLEQVVDNLLSNAAKYASGSKIKVSLNSDGHRARLIVEDEGPGIPAERQNRIFERYERADASPNISGLGLGLFIVKEIVRGHRGSINVQSEEGKGTRFTIDLPLGGPAQPS